MNNIDTVICNHIVTIKKESINEYMKTLSKRVEKKIVKQYRLTKLLNDVFVIPELNDISLLTSYNYNLSQLKDICKHHKLKISGNKLELYNRIYVFFELSNHIIKIQKIYRGFLFRKYVSLFGEGFYNRKVCINETDFLTGDNLTDIKYPQFISIKDDENHSYGFDMVSLHNLLIRSGLNTQNPYTRQVLSINIILNINKLIRLSKLFNQPINLDIVDDEEQEHKTLSFEERTNNLFHNMYLLGNYCEANWLSSLTIFQLTRFLRELLDIWMYRAQLTMQTKRNICPRGNPFRNTNIHELILEVNINIIRNKTLNILEEIVNTGIDQDSQALGSFYVLGALTLVNFEAASALPWLFQSMNYN